VFESLKVSDGSNVIKITFFSFDISCLFFLDQDRINSTDFSLPLSTSKSLIATPIPNATVRHPIKPRTMAQVPIPKEQIDEESSLLNVSSDGDITVLQKRKIYIIYDENLFLLSYKKVIPTLNIYRSISFYDKMYL
jgi:hypothetical protein